jgi:hypothetical protein
VIDFSIANPALLPMNQSFYWSSNESDNNWAYTLSTGNTNANLQWKESGGRIRAIRSF